MVHANKEVLVLMPSHTGAILTQIYDFQVEVSNNDKFILPCVFCSVLE